MFALYPLAVAGAFPTYFVAVYAVGLVAAVSIGLIAWYNSKRPVGWERSKRPDFIPKINTGADSDPPQFRSPDGDIDTGSSPSEETEASEKSTTAGSTDE